MSNRAHVTMGEAPGKAILLGEHFVVYGSPALAVPLPALRLRVRLRPARPGEPPAEGHLGACLGILLAALGAGASDLRADVESDVPVGSGLGSSAALSVALSRAVAAAVGLSPDPARERELSMRCERLAHGRPSGIDTEVCVTGRSVWIEAGRFETVVAGAGRDVGLVVLCAGPGGATGEMVSRVAAFRETHRERFVTLVGATRDRCIEARALLDSGGDRGRMTPRALERLGALLGDQHAALREIGVSTPALDEAVEAAREEGAAGAKLSGAGGGGAVVAIALREGAAALADRLSARGLVVVTAGPLL